jgi:hypothetical protein
LHFTMGGVFVVGRHQPCCGCMQRVHTPVHTRLCTGSPHIN